jgi:dTDP-glucose 4,6-dehydratase
MRIFITGIDGTLGRVLREELRRHGHEVFGCDVHHHADPQIERADIADFRQLERAFRTVKPDIVYHLAAEFGRQNGEEYYEQLWRTNCIGTRNVIECCLNQNAKLIFASSSEAYGDVDGYAACSEDYREEWLDQFAPDFHNEYALTKWTNERQIRIARRHRGLQSVILRFFNAYGPGEYYTPYRSVVCLFTYRLMQGLPITVYRGYKRVFMWVGDWARTAATVADRFDQATAYSAINIGGSEFASVADLKDRIVTLLGGSASEIRYLDAEKANVTSKKPDLAIARRILDHCPDTTLDVGLPATVAWMKEQYSLAQPPLGLAHTRI